VILILVLSLPAVMQYGPVSLISAHMVQLTTDAVPRGSELCMF